MLKTNTKTKIDFLPIALENKASYEACLSAEHERGCEFSFANLFLWGRQYMAEADGCILMFSQFNRRTVYPFPVGAGDKRAAVDAIIQDADARGIPCRLTGLCAAEKQWLEQQYPARFRFHCDAGSFDYVYDINDLADLSGKKYHGKRNHLHRFWEMHPECRVELIDRRNLPAVMQMADHWYESRSKEDPSGDYHMERAALQRAFRHYHELGLIGIALLDGEDVLAFTMGSRFMTDMIDVHFEKARSDIQGAYAAINCEFARYIRGVFPDIRYLDREEDMGLEGLRRAKQSYRPHRMIEKCWACLLEDGCDY